MMSHAKYLQIIAILLFCSLLQGCMRAAVTSANLALDHYDIRQGYQDGFITHRAQRSIAHRSDLYYHSTVDVHTYHGIVLLTGEAQTPKIREQIANLVDIIPYTRYVINDIHIDKLRNHPSINMNDVWITAKIKSKIMISGDIPPDSVNIVTVEGTVYLFGVVYPQQAQKITQLARDTIGVNKVVQIFEYIGLLNKVS